jgi:hypothetical protein
VRLQPAILLPGSTVHQVHNTTMRRHVGTQRSAYAVLMQLSQAAVEHAPVARAVLQHARTRQRLFAGLADEDALARKRCRQAFACVLSAHTQPPDMPQEAWITLHESWGHWLALYDSLDSYALPLLQATWKTHLPTLLEQVNAMATQAQNVSELLDLQLSSATSSAESGTAGRGGTQASWMCLLLERGMAHKGAYVKRFLALCALEAFDAGAGGVAAPWEWLCGSLVCALTQADVVPASAELLATVRFWISELHADIPDF